MAGEPSVKACGASSRETARSVTKSGHSAKYKLALTPNLTYDYELPI